MVPSTLKLRRTGKGIVMHVLRNQFPFLKKTDGRPLVYFDNAATTQKPQVVIDAITHFYESENAPIHRGIYARAEHATELFENVRTQVARFINAKPSEIIFTSGATEGINLVASSWARHHINAADEIVITALEHHSNLLPWQQLCLEKKAVLKIIPLLTDGSLDYDAGQQLITPKTKLVAIVHTSNFLGTDIDVARIAQYAHNVKARVLVDAAQSAPYKRIDIQKLNCDFLVFSAHKMMGPTGVGILYASENVQQYMQPYQYGGGMVYEANYQHATWLKGPRKFEAGTPPIAQVIGLGAAITFLEQLLDDSKTKNIPQQLTAHAIEGLSKIPKVKLLGPLEDLKKSGHLISFIVDDIHAHDVAAYLDKHGICVRAGHHCAQPLAQSFGLDASVRASFYFYNTIEEVDYFLKVVSQV